MKNGSKELIDVLRLNAVIELSVISERSDISGCFDQY
jgi:hypothetical protein